MPAAFLFPRYDGSAVLLSVLVAAFASYVALDLARRVHQQSGPAARVWIAGGALVMGSGIWSMHFIGMLAMSLPIEIHYDAAITLASWGAAVAVSALALALAACERLRPATLGLGALAMGGGICAMHYTGMAALRLAPGIVWDVRWLVVSVAIACGASAVALLIFFGMRRLAGLRARVAQAGAALVMGLAISGMHYAGMAAAGFPADAVCLSVDGLGGRNLGLMVLVAVLLLLTVALFTSALDARLQARASRLAQSLAEANAELQRLVFVDALTGLGNRLCLHERLAQALAARATASERRSAPRPIALLFVDVDAFKPVNDGFGHDVGDEVLRQVARRLSTVLRAGDTLARLGGDEFVLLLDPVSGVDAAASIAQRVLQQFGRPFETATRTLTLSASVGVAVCPDHDSGARLLACADSAMYAAKRAGGAGVVLYEAGMERGAALQLEMLQDLREALAGAQLQLHYQPKVDGQRQRVCGFEALLRWRHPQRGWVSPAVFVPLAERSGLIGAIGDWVVDEACRQLAAWAGEGRRLRVAINLSVYQLRQRDIVERIMAAVRRHGVDAHRLVCEITESAAMEDAQATTRVLRELTAQGVKLSIDDFGTGYSSLARLRSLRAHELKIDREFVADVAHDADARAVVDAIVRLGHALGLRIVAEGVETAGQRDALLALGCDEMQGYYFSRPLPPGALGDCELRYDDGRAPLPFSPSMILGEDAVA
jgi:diguanylate cyclase (GGDEF)-like protein